MLLRRGRGIAQMRDRNSRCTRGDTQLTAQHHDVTGNAVVRDALISRLRLGASLLDLLEGAAVDI